jgi:glutathione S-transferase
MITLKQFKFGKRAAEPDFSSFCIKVEAFLKLHKIDYKNAPGDVRKAPKGKLPVAVIDGVEVGDSELILSQLCNKYHIDMDAHLSPKERAISLAMTKMIEEYLYFTVVHFRWSDPEGWSETKELFFGHAPFFVRACIAPLVRRKMMRDLKGQGISKHSNDEILQFASNGLKAISDLLGDQPYMMGDKISTLDLTVFSALCALLKTPLDSPIKTAALQHRNLVDYADRLYKELW